MPQHISSPDENTFTIPNSWRRLLHPRRGGVPGPALEVDREVAWRLVAEVRDLVDDLLRMLADEQAAAYLRSGGDTATPHGAAVIAAGVDRFLTAGTEWKRAGELAAFVDGWVADHGLVFATRAVAEYERTGIDWKGDPRRPTYYLTPIDGHGKVDRNVEAGPLPARLRAHLAAAGAADHQAAVAALAEYQPGDPLLAAFLVPRRADWPDGTDWAAAACAATSGLPAMLLCALDSIEVIDARATPNDAWWVMRTASTLPTVVEAVGPAIAPAVARWFDSERVGAAKLRRLLGALALLPTDEAFDLLLERLDRKHVRAAVLDAAKRFPARALRLLARSSHPVAAELLRAHVVGHPELAVPADVRETLDRTGPPAPTAVEADASTLPALLVRPPWTGRRPTVRPVVIADVVPDEDVAVVWHSGERQAWAATRGWVSPRFAKGEWEKTVEEYRSGALSAHLEAGLFGAGPEHLVRPLLPNWRPTYLWRAEEWLRSIVARYELDALPLAIHATAVHPATNAGLLVPFASADVAVVMTNCFPLKSARKAVLAWLGRHPRAAARYLIPDALAKPGKERRAAEAMLRLIPSEDVHAAAAAYGEQVTAAVTALLDADPLDLLPKRVPALPEWAELGLLPPILLRDNGTALPASAVEHVITMLAISRPGEVYAGVDVVTRLCVPGSLAEFGWALFRQWQRAGMPAKDGWVLDALGWLGDDETVRRLAPLIRAWPGDGGHARAVHALDVLATIGTDVALTHLHGIAQKVKFKGLKARAQEKIAEVAAGLALSPDQLGDRLVPDLGLDANGGMTLDYGPRRFVVGFDEQLRPYVADEDGTRRKALPKPGANDDENLAPAAYVRFAALKKDARTIATDQVRRLEQAMVSGRRWTAAEFADLFVAHPLLWHIVRRLVWASFDVPAGDTVQVTFRVAEDRTLAGVEDDTLTLPESASVGIAHPVHLADTLPAWRELFADYEILQPFAQLDRPVHTLTDDERAATGLHRFERLRVPTGKVLALTRRGWQRATPQDAGVEPWLVRPLPGNRAAVLNLDPGLAAGAVDMFPEQRIEHVWLSDTGGGDWAPRSGVRFGELDPVTASEVLADLTELTT